MSSSRNESVEYIYTAFYAQEWQAYLRKSVRAEGVLHSCKTQ